MDFVHISSPANPRFKHARSLLRRKARQQHAQLLLEGVRLIEDAMSAGFTPALFLFDPAASEAFASLLARAQTQGAEVASLAAELLAELCDTVTPQGLVAVAPWPQIRPGEAGLSLVVDGVRDPGNLGTLLRSAAAAGVDQVITLPGVTDPWAPKVLRAGMGAHFRTAIRQAAGLAQAEQWTGSARPYLADGAGRELYTAVDWTQPSVLIIGGEAAGAGLAANWPAVQRIAIPMASEVESLNTAMAGSVILFEAARQRRASTGGG